jgi:hypothetical protein
LQDDHSNQAAVSFAGCGNGAANGVGKRAVDFEPLNHIVAEPGTPLGHQTQDAHGEQQHW